MSKSTQDTLERLFFESRAALARYVRRLVHSRDTADEIVQEAFLRTYQHADKLDIPRAFLFSTARNLASSVRRREKVAMTDTVGDLDDLGVVAGNGAVEELLISDEAGRLLREAVDRLPPQCRAAFALKVFHACSYKEIAERLGVTEKTVEKHVARGLQRTHEWLRRRYALPLHAEAPSEDAGKAASTDHG